MPTIEDYENLAPFTLEELVAAANAILRTRPSLQLQPRTVRYYISYGLLPSPSGGPKFARYSSEHLRRLVAIRQWLDQGMSLDQAGDLIKEGKHGGETETHQRKPSPRVMESPRGVLRQERRILEQSVRKLKLTEHSVLEVDSSADLKRELELCAEAIRDEIANL